MGRFLILRGLMQQIRIEYMPLAELVKRYHPRNPKEHDIGGLITSMRKFGFKTPGGIDEKSGLFAEGHGRTIALAEMQRQQMDAPKGIDARKDDWYAPVIRGYEFDTPEQLEAYLITANRMTELGGWDEPKLAEMLQELANTDAELLRATGYDEDDLAALLEELTPHVPTEDPGAQMDKAAELQKKWQVERGQLWAISKHRLLCGDCTNADDVARLMDGEQINGLITDPPYSSGGFTRGDRSLPVDKKYVQTGTLVQRPTFAGDNRDQRSWISWCERWLASYLAMSIDGTVLCVWTDWRQLPALTDAIQGGGWNWRGIAVWNKTEAARPLYGRFRSQCEYLVWGSAGGLPLNDGSPCYPGVITSAVDANKEHITQKPVDVIAWSMSMVIDGGIVADPFGGSGTTMVACEQLGRQCRMIEIEPKYCAVILDRMERMGLTPELVNGT